MTRSNPNKKIKKDHWENYANAIKANTKHWRVYAELRQWRHISPHHVAKEEYPALIAVLEPLVTQRTWGEGLEIHTDFIKPEEAKTREESEALDLLHALRRSQEPTRRYIYPNNFFREIVGPPRRFRKSRYKYTISNLRENSEHKFTITKKMLLEGHDDGRVPLQSPFTDAIELARRIVIQHGIELRYWRSTFVYQDRSSKRWLNISKKRAGIITRRSVQLWGRKRTSLGSQEPRVQRDREEEKWLNRYPWRRCQTLRRYFQRGYIEPNSSLWHAANILDAHDRFRSMCGYETSMGGAVSSRRQVASALLLAVAIGEEIGASMEALRSKQKLEPYAMKQLKRVEDNARGGREKGKNSEVKRQALIANVVDQLKQGRRVTDALRRVAAENLGAKTFRGGSPMHLKEFRRVHRIWYRSKKN